MRHLFITDDRAGQSLSGQVVDNNTQYPAVAPVWQAVRYEVQKLFLLRSLPLSHGHQTPVTLLAREPNGTEEILTMASGTLGNTPKENRRIFTSDDVDMPRDDLFTTSCLWHGDVCLLEL